MISIPQIQPNLDGSVRLSFSYNSHMVPSIKETIPAYARSYESATETRSADAVYTAVAVGVTERVFGVVYHMDCHETLKPVRKTDSAFATAHWLLAAPPDLIEGAYLTLSKLHPHDKGGDAAGMLRLNEAVTALHARLGIAS